MSLLWIEGFETFGSSGAPTAINRKYTAVAPSGMVLSSGRTGGIAIEMSSTSESLETPDVGANPQTIIIGFGFKVTSLITERLIFLRQGGTNNVGIKLNSDGSLSIERTPTVLATTSAGEISTGTWYYIELKATIDNSAGAFELKIDEVTKLNVSGVDTQASTNAYTDTVLFRGLNGGIITYDDLYVIDTLGSENNDFLGKSVIRAMYPNAAGDASDLTPDSGSNYARVNETVVDDDTSYVESSTTGHKDLHNHDNISPTGVIRGIQINTQVRDTVSGGSSLKSLVKSGTTTDTGSADTIDGTSYEHQFRILEQDPDTSAAWTLSGTDAAQIGYEVG